MSTKEFEKTSLDAHVELCAERYGQLDKRLNNLEERTAKIEELVISIKETISDSASRRSNGVRSPSANAEIKYSTKESGLLVSLVHSETSPVTSILMLFSPENDTDVSCAEI